MANFAVVGQSVYRKDANPKVTGRALHVGNIDMPGMLQVGVLRSPYPHARILHIDKSKAEALAGVAVVLTGADIAKMPGVDPHFGPAFRDQPMSVFPLDLRARISTTIAPFGARSLKMASVPGAAAPDY